MNAMRGWLLLPLLGLCLLLTAAGPKKGGGGAKDEESYARVEIKGVLRSGGDPLRKAPKIYVGRFDSYELDFSRSCNPEDAKKLEEEIVIVKGVLEYTLKGSGQIVVVVTAIEKADCR